MRIVFVLILLIAAANRGSLRAEERVVLHPDGGDPADVELFMAKPEGSGSWPVMLFVHGHQSPPRPGARVFVHLDRRPQLATIDEGRLETMRERGYLAAAVSLPGYGRTTGSEKGSSISMGPGKKQAERPAGCRLMTDAVEKGFSAGAASNIDSKRA